MQGKKDHNFDLNHPNPTIMHMNHIWVGLEHLHPHTSSLGLRYHLPHPTYNVKYSPIPTHKHEKLNNIKWETI
jgi:hypothetical protein